MKTKYHYIFKEMKKAFKKMKNLLLKNLLEIIYCHQNRKNYYFSIFDIYDF